MDTVVFHCNLGEKQDIKLVQRYFQFKLYDEIIVSCKKKRYLTPSSGLVRECDT